MTTGDHQSQSRDLSCAQCGATTVSTSWVDDTLVWGSGESAMTISVCIPFRSCRSCDFTYLDDEAEDIRHNAVCRHLGVLTPSEIRGIREEYQMSQAEFARATGLGEATVGRWENGLVIQNVANDRYLRLLRYRGAMRLLQCFSGRPVDGPDDEHHASNKRRTPGTDVRWRALVLTDKHFRDQEAFAGPRGPYTTPIAHVSFPA